MSRSHDPEFEEFIKEESADVQFEARVRYYRRPVPEDLDSSMASRHELVPRRAITDAMIQARQIILRYLSKTRKDE